MGEMLMAIIFFLAILAIATVAFWVWLVAVIARMVGRALRSVFGTLFFETAGDPQTSGQFACPRPRCRTANPPGARFCRRCGRELPRYRPPVTQRRAAMW